MLDIQCRRRDVVQNQPAFVFLVKGVIRCIGMTAEETEEDDCLSDR